jgi:chaperonin GroEL
MEYNNPSEIVKDLTFGEHARDRVMQGVEKLANAVASTLGASGKCVIYEDAMGNPVITKDGVTVAESIVLLNPVENIGATLIKEAAKKTVREAGDGTTTATVLAYSLLQQMNEASSDYSIREIKTAVLNGLDKVLEYLDEKSIEVKDEMLEDVASISCNNDKILGKIIADAYKTVGENGVVLMEESDTEETFSEIVDGVQFDCGIKSQHLVTDKEKNKAILENPYVLIIASQIPTIRKIQSVLEHVIKEKRSLLIVAGMDQQPMAALLMNKVKGNINVNIIDTPGFGATKMDTMQDLATITGAQVINEELGDDLDLINPSVLGEAKKAVTDATSTVITIEKMPEEAKERIGLVNKKIKTEKNPFIKTKLEQRLAMLSGAVAILKVGANSKIELKEKKDRVEDAIYAVKAAIKEGIVAGGGVALHNASTKLKDKHSAEKILCEAIKAPYKTILENAGINYGPNADEGNGIDVTTGELVNMVKKGIVDPVLVTKKALINAVSVASTIISADCVISNIRDYASN